MLDYDTTRLPAAAAEWRGLVAALAATDDYSETHYLEMKSALDMRDNADFFKIPKFILAAANRMPDDAAPYFDGHALMVLGVKQGSAEGLQNPLESKDIRPKVNQYTGVDRISWEVHYVPVEADPTRQVVIVVVDPPQWGDPIRICHQRFTKKVPSTKKPGECTDSQCPYPRTVDQVLAENGTIFYRPDGETRQATARDIEHLMQRALTDRAAAPRVTIHGAALRITYDERLLHWYLDMWGKYFEAEYVPPGSIYRAISADQRSKRAYFTEVYQWAEAVEDVWDELTTAAGVFGQDEHQIWFEVANDSSVSLKRPNLTIRFEGAVDAEQERDSFNPSQILPEPPAAHGTTTLQNLILGSSAIHTLPAPALFRAAHRFDSITAEYTPDPEGVTLEVDLEDSRAHHTHKVPTDGLFVVTYEPEATELRGTWELSAAEHGRPPYRGELQLPIIDVDVTSHLVERLKRPKRSRQ